VPWIEAVHLPTTRKVFKWEGGTNQIRELFTEDEIAKYNLRPMGKEGNGDQFMMVQTLHGPACAKIGDWGTKADWCELYFVKDDIHKREYTTNLKTIVALRFAEEMLDVLIGLDRSGAIDHDGITDEENEALDHFSELASNLRTAISDEYEGNED